MASIRRWLGANAPLLVLFSTLGVYLAVLLPRLIWFDKDGLWVGHEHLWSDWPLHIGMLRRFSDCPPDQWLAQHPMVGGLPLRYPFFAALVSGLLVRGGMGVPLAMVLPMYVGFALLLVGMYRLWTLLLGRTLASARSDLSVLSLGGAGRLRLASSNSGSRTGIPDGAAARVWPLRSVSMVRGELPRRDAADPAGVSSGNDARRLDSRRSGKSPARRWAFGSGAESVVSARRDWRGTFAHCPRAQPARGSGFWRRLRASKRRKTVHSSIASGGVARARTWRDALPGVSPSADAVSRFRELASGIHGADAPRLAENVVVALGNGASGGARRGGALARRGPFLWGGALLFVLANLILFQPIPWDNSKVFLWAYFGLSGSMAGALAWIWQRGWLLRPFAVVLALWLTITGFANLVHLMRTEQHRSLILERKSLPSGRRFAPRRSPTRCFSRPPMSPILRWCGARDRSTWDSEAGCPTSGSRRRRRSRGSEPFGRSWQAARTRLPSVVKREFRTSTSGPASAARRGGRARPPSHGAFPSGAAGATSGSTRFPDCGAAEANAG